MNCGCWVRYPKCKGNTMSYVKNEIVYCPLHAHAEEIWKAATKYMNVTPFTKNNTESIARKRLSEALAAANGGEGA